MPTSPPAVVLAVSGVDIMRLPRHRGPRVHLFVLVVLAAGAGSRSAGAQATNVVRYELDARSLVDGSREELSHVWEPRAIPSGGVSFTEIGEPVLRLFGSDGQSLGTIGSRGAGPGEFRLITGHGWLGDTVWVTDRQLRRTSYFSRDGKLLRTVPWPAELARSALPRRPVQHVRAITPLSYLPNGHLLMAVHFEEANAARAGFPAGSEYALVEADSSGLVLNEILHAGRFGVCSAQWRAEKTGGSTPVPYCSRHYVAVSPGGLRSVRAEQGGKLAGGQAKLLVKNSHGKTLADVTLALPVMPLPAPLFEAEIAKIRQAIPNAPPEQRAAIDRMPRATVFPAFGEVLVADDGVVWLQRWTRSGTKTWVRIHPERALAVVPLELPTGFRPFSLWKNGVWGTMQDADGVPSVGFASRRE